METQLIECLSMIATERARATRNTLRLRNLRFMLRNIRAELNLHSTIQDVPSGFRATPWGRAYMLRGR